MPKKKGKEKTEAEQRLQVALDCVCDAISELSEVVNEVAEGSEAYSDNYNAISVFQSIVFVRNQLRLMLSGKDGSDA